MSCVRRLPLSPAIRVLLAAACLLAAAPAASAEQAWNPVADPRAVVIEGAARFTVLTPRLVRMEWSADGTFEDHASLVFVNRRLPVPEFRVTREDGWLILRTAQLVLRYRPAGGAFTPDDLRAEFTLNGTAVTWTPGMEDRGNLQGTIRTLDGVKGSAPLGAGIVSRDGWVVVDDAERPLFDNSDWPWVMERPKVKRQDWYLFAYGHDYRAACAIHAGGRADPDAAALRIRLPGGRATGPTPTPSSRNSSAGSRSTTSRSTCSSSTWTGTPPSAEVVEEQAGPVRPHARLDRLHVEPDDLPRPAPRSSTGCTGRD